MTDNEIIKAFKCLCGEEIFCRECKYSGRMYYPECRQQVAKDTLDLINRQQAENKKNENIIRLADKTIETQNAEIERVNNHIRDLTKKVKSEAYKEFAERLKEEAVKTYYGELVFTEDDIDNLLKEMG